MEQSINRLSAGSVFGRGKLWGKRVRRQAKHLPGVKFPVAQEVVGGLLFDEKKVIFARILVPVIVGRGFLNRRRQASLRVRIQEMQGGYAQEQGEQDRR
jgi:hypothetical protein